MNQDVYVCSPVCFDSNDNLKRPLGFDTRVHPDDMVPFQYSLLVPINSSEYESLQRSTNGTAGWSWEEAYEHLPVSSLTSRRPVWEWWSSRVDRETFEPCSDSCMCLMFTSWGDLVTFVGITKFDLPFSYLLSIRS